MRTSIGRIVGVSFALLATIGRTRAQCHTWDGTIGQGLNGEVYELTGFNDGSGPALYAGWWTGFGTQTQTHVAKRTSSGWTTLGPAIQATAISALAVFDDGSGPVLYVAGNFPNGPSGAVYKRTGSTWTGVGGFDQWVHTLAVLDDGSGPALYVGGSFESVSGGNTAYAPRIARWDGATWSGVGAIGQGNHSVYAITTFDDGSGTALYAGGSFFPNNNLVRWNGTSWSGVGGGVDGVVYSLAVTDDGSGPALYVSGSFTTAGASPANRIARWNGAAWSPLGSGFDQSPGLCTFDDGSGSALYAFGGFTSAGGVPAVGIARWNGSSWSALPSGGPPSVGAFTVFDDGQDGDADLYVVHQLQSVFEWHGCGTEAFCFGDGSSAACPCANSGQIGKGCDNSATTGGALLSATGTASPDALVLTSSGELPDALSIFLQGDQALATPVIFGDGLRCAGGNLKRLFVNNASAGVASAPASGDPSITAQSASLGDPIAPGSTRVYQVYYRDPDLAFCPSPQGASFNASNALSIVW